MNQEKFYATIADQALTLATDWDWTEDPWFLHSSRTFYDEKYEGNVGHEYEEQNYQDDYDAEAFGDSAGSEDSGDDNEKDEK